MGIDTSHENGVLVVRLHGELDHHAVEHLREEVEGELESVRHRYLVISLHDIDFMDSSGLGLILGRYRSVSQYGGKMALCEVSPPLYRLFELSGIFKVLPVYESEDEAIRAVKGA